MFRRAAVVCLSVHPVAVLNAELCMTCTLLMLVGDARGTFQSLSHDCLVGRHERLLLVPYPVAVSVFIICRCVCVCAEML